MTEPFLHCNIEDIAKWHPWFFLEPHIVSCAAVLAQYGDSTAAFDVECSNIELSWLPAASSFRLEVAWSRETAKKAVRLRATVQAKPLVEMASTAVALLLAHRVLRLGQLDVTRYGERTDFRSARVSCMLEVCRSIVGSRQLMAKMKPYDRQLKLLMTEKSRLLSKAEALEQMGLVETAQPLWATAAACEERIAPLLELLDRESEAALHRISAASCFEKCGDRSRAANLYRAALASPLSDAVKEDIRKSLSACLKQLQRATAQSVA